MYVHTSDDWAGRAAVSIPTRVNYRKVRQEESERVDRVTEGKLSLNF